MDAGMIDDGTCLYRYSTEVLSTTHPNDDHGRYAYFNQNEMNRLLQEFPTHFGDLNCTAYDSGNGNPCNDSYANMWNNTDTGFFTKIAISAQTGTPHEVWGGDMDMWAGFHVNSNYPDGHGRRGPEYADASPNDFATGDFIARNSVRIGWVTQENGDVGKYFYFNLESMNIMLDDTSWNGENWEVHQYRPDPSGDYIVKSGDVKLWNADSPNSDVYSFSANQPDTDQFWDGTGHGRWNSNAEIGDWENGDYLVLVVPGQNLVVPL